jgi:anti-sigma factor RsiW
MNCEFTEKISLLIDGELSQAEATEVTTHLAGCDSCQRAHDDFLRVRNEIESYATTSSFVSQRRALLQILASGKPSLWRRRIVLPAPVFALLLVALIALGVWVASVRRAAPAEAERKPGKVLTMPVPSQDSQDGIDLARFDRGERAAIYKVRRTEQGDVER